MSARPPKSPPPLPRLVRYYSALDGDVRAVDLDARTFALVDPLTGRRVACRFAPALGDAAAAALGRRATVEGTFRFTRAGRPVWVRVERIAVLPRREDLPQFGPGEKVDITGGLSSEEFVRRLRDDD